MTALHLLTGVALLVASASATAALATGVLLGMARLERAVVPADPASAGTERTGRVGR